MWKMKNVITMFLPYILILMKNNESKVVKKFQKDII